MKNLIIKFFGTVLFLLLLSWSVQAQTKSNPLESFHTKLTFEGETYEKDIALKVTKESKYFRLNIKGKIRGGKASAILYTLTGRRVCGLGLDARKGRYSKGTMGEELEVRDGTYILKIRNKNGRGYLNIDYSLH